MSIPEKQVKLNSKTYMNTNFYIFFQIKRSLQLSNQL